MKKATGVVWGGVFLILTSLLVLTGCPGVSSGDANWKVNEKDKKVWERDNSSNKFVRAFEQFGSSKNVKSAVVRVELANLGSSKAGLVFGLNDYVKGSSYQYFLVGVGGSGYSTTEGEYYISYYYDVKMESLSESNDNQNASGNHISIVENTKLTSGSMNFNGTNGDVFISVEETGNEKKTVTVKIGSGYDVTNKVVTGTITTKTFEIGKGATNSGVTDTANKLADVTSIEGGIGAYGMLKPPAEGAAPTKVKNTYDVRHFTGTLALAAEEE